VIIQGSRTPTFFEENKQSADGFRMLSFSDYMDLFETMLPRNPLVNHHFPHFSLAPKGVSTATVAMWVTSIMTVRPSYLAT
jgi:hypothetical protein